MGLDGPPDARSPVPATQLAPLVVHYLQSCKDNGAPPRDTPLVSTNADAAYQGCLLVAKTHQGVVSNGLRLSAYWEPDPAGGLWTFGIDPPGASPRYVSNPLLMACFSVLVRNIYTPARPYAVLVQQQDRANWGPALAPGLYSQIVSSSLHSLCLVTNGTQLSALGYQLPRDYAESGTKYR